MKKLIVWVNVVLLVVVFNFIISVYAEDVPEFDGGYIKLQNGEYLEMKTKSANMTLGGAFFVNDKIGIVTVDPGDFKGILIKGQYNFQAFTLHPLVREDFREEVRYAPSNKIDVRSKSEGSDAYYFQPRYPLEEGDYVAWIDQSFWLFSIKSKDMQSKTPISSLVGTWFGIVQEEAKGLKYYEKVVIEARGNQFFFGESCASTKFFAKEDAMGDVVIASSLIEPEPDGEWFTIINEWSPPKGGTNLYTYKVRLDEDTLEINIQYKYVNGSIEKRRGILTLLKGEFLSEKPVDDGLSDAEKRSNTVKDIRALGTGLGSFSVDKSTFPVQQPEGDWQTQLLSSYYYEGPIRDNWGTVFRYWSDGNGYRIISYGSDRQPGGNGYAADIVYKNGRFIAPDELAGW